MTYSVAFKGAGAHNPFAPKVVTLDDLYSNQGGQQYAMAQGTPFLGQGPGGQQLFFKIDAERSDPSRGLIFLLRQ